jgi:hypothetical protein
MFETRPMFLRLGVHPVMLEERAVRGFNERVFPPVDALFMLQRSK